MKKRTREKRSMRKRKEENEEKKRMRKRKRGERVREGTREGKICNLI